MAIITQEIEELLHKDMTRKEFLRLSAAALLSVIGVTGFLHNMQKLASGANNHQQANRLNGYGSSPYGK